MSTERFARSRSPTREFATQSGPMLVIDGKIHPGFIEGSTRLKRRNGVGVRARPRCTSSITETHVNFDQFARFFRDRLGCDNALFLDGDASPASTRRS